MFVRRILLLPSFRPTVAFSSSAPKVKSVHNVLLFGLDGKIMGTKTKAEAEAIAKRLNFALKRKMMPAGHETKEPSYELYDPKSDFDQSLSEPASVTERRTGKSKKAPSTVREKKKIQIGANINDHDIETKAKTIAKFLKANIEVQIVAFGQVRNERLEEIYKQFEALFTGLRFVQKIVKPGTLKFTILPDPEFTGITPRSSKPEGEQEQEQVDPDTLIDDKELEELIQQKLKEKKH